MPLEEIPSETALKNLRRRPAIWPERGKNNRKGLAPWPEVPRTFEFSDTERFFCMGSCFAQHVGIALSRAGFEVLTEVPHPTLEGHFGGSNHMIRYNVFAMLNEIRWACDSSRPYSKELFLEDANGLWMDPFGHSIHKAHTEEELLQHRAFTGSVTRSCKEASVLVMTLGLVEVWFDRKHGLYTNVQPSKTALLKEPHRFVLRVLGYEDILEALAEIQATLERQGRPDFKMLLTTSPVPLQVTYRGQDVFVANTYSKSVQRAALEVFIKNHPNTYYIPSYETVILGNPDFVWRDDLRHVNEVTVSSIMEHVVRTFAPKKALTPHNMARLQAMSEQWEKIGGANALNNLVALINQNAQLKAEIEALKAGRAA